MHYLNIKSFQPDDETISCAPPVTIAITKSQACGPITALVVGRETKVIVNVI